MLSKKKYFNPDIQTVLNLIGLNNKVEVLGSFGLRSQLYFSDIDCYEVVKLPLKSVEKKFKDIIKNLLEDNTFYIGDIKLGYNEDLRIIDEKSYIHNKKIYHYNYEESKKKLKEIKQFLTFEEYNKANKLLVKNPTEKQLNEIKKELRFHIVRWKPFEIQKGFKILRDNKKYTLLEAFKSGSLFKLDIVKYLNNNFLDFSIIYDLRDEKGLKINKISFNVVETLQNDIKTYTIKKQYFKVLKRKFSLLKYEYEYKGRKENKQKIIILSKILNGNLGKIYQVISNIDNIIYLIDNFKHLDKNRIRENIKIIIDRLSFIYDKQYLKKENEIVGDLLLILKDKSIGNINELLIYIYERLENILNKEAFKIFVNLSFGLL